MVFFPPVALTSQMVLMTSAASTALGTLTASVAKNFFLQIFMNPGGNFMGVVIICALPVAACLGSAFLIKMLFDKVFFKKI
jgi:hypothetical protein